MITKSNQNQEQILYDILTNLKPAIDIYDIVKKNIIDRTGKIKYKTGIDELDDILWGLHKRELFTFGARTSNGKSIFALQAAKTLVNSGATVVYFSLEMSKEQLMERLISNVCEIDADDLRRGTEKSKIQLKEKHEFIASWIKDIDLYIDDINGHHFDKIIHVCKSTKPDFVIIDYIQMISTKGFKSKLDAIEDFVKEIHLLGKQNNFGTILISQINRQGTERPYLEHLKHAGILEEHSDTVVLAQYKWETKEYCMWIEKQRHGSQGKIISNFEPKYNRILDMTEKEKHERRNQAQSY